MTYREIDVHIPNDPVPIRMLTLVPGQDPDEFGEIVVATCGHCGRSWNDASPSAWTPAPSGRCPFEYEHE